MMILTMATAWACSAPFPPQACEDRYPSAHLLSEGALIPQTAGPSTLPHDAPLLVYVPPDYFDDWQASLRVRTGDQNPSALPFDVEYDPPIARVWLTDAFDEQPFVNVVFRPSPVDDERRTEQIAEADAIQPGPTPPAVSGWSWGSTPEMVCGEPTDDLLDALSVQTDAPFGTVLVDSPAALYPGVTFLDADGNAEIGWSTDCPDFVPQASDTLTITVVDRFGNRSDPVPVDSLPGSGSTELGADAGCGCAAAWATPSTMALVFGALLVAASRRRSRYAET